MKIVPVKKKKTDHGFLEPTTAECGPTSLPTGSDTQINQAGGHTAACLLSLNELLSA